jgi:hypothetical protein
MLSWQNLNCNMDWKECFRKLSRPIWSTMWIRSDDRGWCHDLIWGDLWIGTNSEIMIYWPNLKCYVYWEWCERKLSLPILSTIWIRTDDRGLCHDLICGALWIGTYENDCFHDLLWSAMWTGKVVSGRF